MRKTFNSAVNSFSIICDILFYQFNVLTYEALYDSELYEQYFMAAYDLAEAMVMSPVHHNKIQNLNIFYACSDEDIIHDITYLFVKKFPTIIKAMIRKGEEHNHKNYSSCIVSSYLLDLNNRYSFKTERTSETSQKKNYSFSSLNNSVSDEESCGAFFIDLLESEDLSPEEKQIAEAEKVEAIERILFYMELLSNHKSKGELLSLVLYGLKADGLGETVSETANQLYHAGRTNLAVIFKEKLLKYNHEVLQIDDNILEPYLSLDNDAFGEFDMSSPDAIAAKLSRWNSLAKHELAEYLHIELPKSTRSK